MKEKIYEEFGYKVDVLTYHREYISFFYNGFYYLVQASELSADTIRELSQIIEFLENYNIFFHQFIRGFNDYLFNYNNKKYVLMKVRIFYEREITLNEILALSSINIDKLNLNIINPAQRIENKIDFLEQYIANYEKNYALEDLNYYIGLSENAILLYNLIEVKNISIAHKRIHKKERPIDFYNPLNIILDTKSRDLAEYVKTTFFESNHNLIFDSLQHLKLEEWPFYFARLLYPSYYFDCLEDIIIHNTDLNCQKKISQKANEYEKNLKQLYTLMQRYINVPTIEWLSDIDDF